MMARAQPSVSTREVRPCSRSASPEPGQSTWSTETPRAAISVGQPEVYMCSLVESRPFHMIMTGTGSPCLLALVKYAGRVVPSKGTATLVVAGSTSSKDFSISSRQCRYVGTRSGEELLSIRSAWQRYAAARRYFWPAVRTCPAFSASRACSSTWSATRRQDAMNSSVPTSAPRIASSRIGRHARSTSSIVPPEFRVATTPRFQM
jgi:hypothetical protein